MAKDVEAYVKKCKLCQKNKQAIPNKMPMVITDTPTAPFERIFLDLVGPLQETSKGNKYILTFMDDLTKYFDWYAIPDAEAATASTLPSNLKGKVDPLYNTDAKLDEVYSVPYTVLKSSGVDTTIKIGRREVVVHNNRLKLCID